MKKLFLKLSKCQMLPLCGKLLSQILPTDAFTSTAPMAQLCETDTAVIMFTGVTTGKSKGAILSHGALMQGTVNGCYGIRDVFYQKYLLVLPLTHVFGLIRNLMTCLYTASTLFICDNNKDMFRDCTKG